MDQAGGGVVAPRGQEPVPVLVDHEWRQVVVGTAVSQAILIVGEDIDEVVASVIPPRDRPLPGPTRMVLGVLTAAPVPTFHVSRWVDHQTGVAEPVGHRLGGKAKHFPNGGYVGRRVFDVGELHLFDQPFAVHQGKTPFRVVGRVEIGARRPDGSGAATVSGDMTVAADDPVDLVRSHPRVLHGQLTGEYGVRAQGLVHGCFVPAPVNRGMPESGHRHLAAVFPYSQTVFISPPLIWSLCSHHSPIFITKVVWTGPPG